MLRKFLATVFACFAVMGPGMALADMPANADPSAELDGGSPPEAAAPAVAPSASPVVVNVEAPAPAPVQSPFAGVSFLAAVAAATAFVIANMSAICNLAVLVVRQFSPEWAQKIRSAAPFAIALAKPDGPITTDRVIQASRELAPDHPLREAIDEMAKALGLELPPDPPAGA
jgi:hypothetical protein